MQQDDFEQAPIHYSETEPSDPLANWQSRLRNHSLKFDHSSERVLLKRLLRVLNVSKASQVLVFSKTSLQIDHIRPSGPRAVYFSEEYHIGWVRGGAIEIISFDDKIGLIFYTMTVPDRNSASIRTFIRSRDCLGCHNDSRTDHVPGVLVRSLNTDVCGFPIFSAGSFRTNPKSPLKERWAGWYVTRSNGGECHMENSIWGIPYGEFHMGNLLRRETAAVDNSLHPVRDLGVTLETHNVVLEIKPYLQNTGDVVALMVMKHQMSCS